MSSKARYPGYEQRIAVYQTEEKGEHKILSIDVPRWMLSNRLQLQKFVDGKIADKEKLPAGWVYYHLSEEIDPADAIMEYIQGPHMFLTPEEVAYVREFV